MAGLGRKTFSPGDVLTSSDVQGYLMDQSVMVFAGTAARTSAIPSPSAGMVAYSTATSLQVYNGSAWVDASTGYGSASGGASSTAITVAGTAYTMLTFTADATLTVSKAGLFDVLVVGGAGGAGANTGLSSFMGGGGGGGVAEQTIYLTATTYAIDIGAGGAKSSSGLTTRLVTSDLKSLSGVGGGVGGGYAGGQFERIGKAGGCGGGGLSGNGTDRPEAGLGLQGFGGGTGQSLANLAAGSGGGATAAGTTGSTTVATVGGAGYDASTFRGETAGTTYYAGGGSGGGASGGGTTAGSTARGTNGAANKGSGGGGNTATGNDDGGSGSSGILLIRFKA